MNTTSGLKFVEYKYPVPSMKLNFCPTCNMNTIQQPTAIAISYSNERIFFKQGDANWEFTCTGGVFFETKCMSCGRKNYYRAQDWVKKEEAREESLTK